MAVKIRLTRMGDKKSPFYRIVVSDSRKSRSGEYIEQLGYFNPKTQPEIVKVDAERAAYWVGNGAEPTDTVKVLLKKNGVSFDKSEKKAKKAEKKPAKKEAKVEEKTAKKAPAKKATKKDAE